MRARLDARLRRNVEAPLAVALSGGGDSVALLTLAADWARANGRRVLALTVDHGLNLESRDWSRQCETVARAAGADWRELRWTGDKPGTGLPAAARKARHALLADAARAAGAAVILLGHTADDVAESDLIRAEGTPIGRLREWAPSPAWPEGRGLMLLRPLLGERRATLRDLLKSRGLDWIEDPANADLRFARARVRAALRGADAGSAADAAEVQRPWTWRALWSGAFEVDREMSPAFLAALALSAAGTDRPPRGTRVQRLRNRLAAPGEFGATLAGAAFSTWRDLVLVGREPGRAGLPCLRLEAGRTEVWDGRFQITATASALVVAAGGCRNTLSDEDRDVTRRVRQWDAAALPVLVRDDGSAPVLAWREAEVVTLAPRRLSLAAGETTHERDLSKSVDGERPPADLF